jgi:peptidyl-prolyl cis-trans isomerase C
MIMQIRKSLALLALLLPLHATQAETSKIIDLVNINDFNITNLHLAIFSAQSASPEGEGEGQDKAGQQAALLNELISTFMLANSEDGQKMLDTAQVKASLAEIDAAVDVQRAHIIARALIQDRLENAEVSDQELEKVYNAEYVDAPHQEFKARHILLDTEDEAKAIIDELKKGGDFAELAKTKSTGPSKSVGGDLGWFSPDQMVPSFSAAVAGLKDSAYSTNPVKTQFGWHVILREASRELATPKLQDIKDEVARKVRTAKLTEYIQNLRAETKVNVLNDDVEK